MGVDLYFMEKDDPGSVQRSHDAMCKPEYHYPGCSHRYAWETGADVLNGTVFKGDRVAYSTRQGNSSAIHLGVVEEVTTRATWNKTFPVLKIRVDCETGGIGIQKIRTVEKLDRVVIVDSPAAG